MEAGREAGHHLRCGIAAYEKSTCRSEFAEFAFAVVNFFLPQLVCYHHSKIALVLTNFLLPQ